MTNNLKDKFQFYGHNEYLTPDRYFLGGIFRPDKIDSLDRITDNDKAAQKIIQAAQELIHDMESYRNDLFLRAQEFYQSGYRLQLKIQRMIDYYKNKVFYIVEILHIPNVKGAKPLKKLSERFEGKDRHKALHRFAALKKLYPGIDCIEDIKTSV